MVHTFKPTIVAILTLSAAAPSFAAPLKLRVDSGFSTVNNRAPDAAAKETSSDVGPAVLNHHLAARGAEIEADAKTGAAKSEGFLHSPIARGFLGRAVLAAISSNLRREPESANALSRELATELEARGAISRAITGGGVPNDLTHHLNRAGGTSANSASAESAGSSSGSGWTGFTPLDGGRALEVPNWDDQSSTPPQSPWTPPGSPWTPPESPSTPPGSPWTPPESPSTPPESPSTPPESPSTPNQSPSTPNQSPSTPQDDGINTITHMMKNLALGTPVDTITQMMKNLNLHGRSVEDLFARSFGIGELD